jgi:hypothetical protein
MVIASEVNYVLKTLVEQASKFAVHARRKRLCGEDLDAALAMHEIPVRELSSPDSRSCSRLSGSSHASCFRFVSPVPPDAISFSTVMRRNWN